MEINTTYHCTQWLSLEQIRQLLTDGEILIASNQGDLRLLVTFADRVAAQEFAKLSTERKPLKL